RSRYERGLRLALAAILGNATMSLPLLQPNDTGIAEARSLFKDADSVELKMTVGDGDRHSAITGLDVLDAQLRQVVFFDTPDLTPPRLALRASPAPTPGSRARSSRAPRSR